MLDVKSKVRNILVLFLLLFFATPYVFAMTYNEAKSQTKPIVILFKKNGCKYCRDYEPYFNDMEKKYSYKFNFVKEECSSSISEIASQLKVESYPEVFLILYQYNKAYPISNRWELDKILKEYNP